MKKTYLSIAFLCVSLLSACALQIPVDVASGVILASDKVETMQVELGEYSNHQSTIDDLEELQANIKKTLNNGSGALFVDDYYNEALIIYSVLKKEVISRQNELSPEQLNSLVALDNELIALNASILELKARTKSTIGVDGSELLSTVYRASILMSYYKGL